MICEMQPSAGPLCTHCSWKGSHEAFDHPGFLLLDFFGLSNRFHMLPASGKKKDDWVDVLKNDPRLKVAMKYNSASGASADEMLDVLQKATGVALSLAGQLEKGKVSFGLMGGVNVPAWRVMENIALVHVTDGSWQKTGDGYALHGKPKDFGPAVKKPDPAKVAKAEPPKVVKAEPPKYWVIGDSSPMVNSKNPMLRADKRLTPMINVSMRLPTVAEIFARVKDASGVELELSPELKNHAPYLGYLEKGFPCWGLMEILAKKELEDARWEKTATGYRLSGISKTPPGRDLVASDGQVPWPADKHVQVGAPAGAGNRLYWFVGGGAALVLIAAAFGAGVILGKRLAARRSKSGEGTMEKEKQAEKPMSKKKGI